jgi:hypothetical protein
MTDHVNPQMWDEDEQLPTPYDPAVDEAIITKATASLTPDLLALGDEHRLDELDEALELIAKRVGSDAFPADARALAGGVYAFRGWVNRQGGGPGVPTDG